MHSRPPITFDPPEVRHTGLGILDWLEEPIPISVPLAEANRGVSRPHETGADRHIPLTRSKRTRYKLPFSATHSVA